MVFFNYSTMQMAAKVVYYGPGLCGKTTNLQWIFDHTSNDSRGEMVSLATETDRTLFFDLLPIDVGSIAGFSTRIQLYTVPGQVFYNTTRKLVLKGVDGVVFVADSQRPMLQANLESFHNLEENLGEMGLSLDNIPLVLQYNKRDLPGICSVEELNQALNRNGWPAVESSAIDGQGVFETLKTVSKMTLLALKKRLTKGRPETAAARTTVPRSLTAPTSSSASLAKRGEGGEKAAAPPPAASEPEVAEVEAVEVAAVEAVEVEAVEVEAVEVEAPPEERDEPDLAASAAAAVAELDEIEIDEDAFPDLDEDEAPADFLLADEPAASAEAEPFEDAFEEVVAEEAAAGASEDETAAGDEIAAAGEEVEKAEEAEEAAVAAAEAEVPVAPAAPPPRPAGRRARKSAGIDALAELEKIRQQALHPTHHAAANGKGELRRDLELALSPQGFRRARRVALTLQIEDADRRAVDEAQKVYVDIDDPAAIERLLLRLHIALHPSS